MFSTSQFPGQRRIFEELADKWVQTTSWYQGTWRLLFSRLGCLQIHLKCYFWDFHPTIEEIVHYWALRQFFVVGIFLIFYLNWWVNNVNIQKWVLPLLLLIFEAVFSKIFEFSCFFRDSKGNWVICRFGVCRELFIYLLFLSEFKKLEYQMNYS